MSSGQPTIFDVRPTPGLVLIDALLAVGDVVFSPPLRGITVGTAGDLKVDTVMDTAVVIPANCLAVGIQHGMIIKKIYQTGTTALELVGLR